MLSSFDSCDLISGRTAINVVDLESAKPDASFKAFDIDVAIVLLE